MDSNKKTNHTKDEGMRQLLKEGGQSYFHAMSALFEYRREVQKRCRNVLLRMLPEYKKALGVEVTPENIKNYTEPALERWNGSWANVGAKVANVAPSLGIQWGGMWYGLAWEQTDEGTHLFYLWHGVYLPRPFISVISSAMHGVRSTLVIEEYGTGLYLSRDLEGEAVVAFEEPLTDLLREWNNSLKKSKFGTLKKLLSSVTVAASDDEEGPPAEEEE